MKDGRRTDRWLTASVALVLLASLAFLLVSGYRLNKRQLDLSETSLERTQQMFRSRLDAMFHEIGEDLREEAAVLEDSVQHEPWRMVERWRPLLDSHWAIMAIRAADEHGNELEYSRHGDDRKVIITHEGSKERSPLVLDPQTQDTLESAMLERFDPVYDPRQRIWFSKALENTRDEPTWNIKYVADTAPPLLQVSMLIRSIHPERPFQILEMDVDLSRSIWVDTKASPTNRYGSLLLDGSGNVLGIPDVHHDALIVRAEQQAAEFWSRERGRTPFSVKVDDQQYRSLVMPYPLNGLTLYAGVLMNVDIIAQWTRPEVWSLFIMAILVLLLTILLAWLALRKRKEDQRMKRQARRSRSQEKKLAKALGEREVLNREVHHRVKNNLQVVSSLLNLQATRLDEGPVRTEFMRGKKRIDLIALVHHKLYGMKDLRNVDIGMFFNDLITSLAAMHQPQSRTVSFEVDTEGSRADQDTAIELGIILCELVSNCYQHAFPYATGGHVDISVRQVDNDLYRLLVKDNGQGLREDYLDGQGKLGLEIVDALAQQLDGSFHVRQNAGVIFEVLFRMNRQPYSDPLEA